jgi:aminopeptidase-like protein
MVQNQNKIIIKKLFKILWPINRSITGKGFLKSLKIINKFTKSLKIKKVKTGTKVYDWKIPKEWNVKTAWIKDENGKEIINYKKNNLHLVGYSHQFNKVISFNELNQHLYSLKNQKDAIPYVTSYYKKTWGFCLSEKQRKKIDKKSKYHVFIDSSLTSGFLRYGEIFLKGKSSKVILLSTYLCHPSLANNELSGPILASLITKWLKSKKNYYSYRIVFLPETIGSIAFIQKNIKYLKEKVLAGFVLTCVGDERNYSYLPSRDGNTTADKVIQRVLINNKIKYKKYNWLDRGSDERQYCSPGIDLPVASLMRSKYGTFKEYHTSKDLFGKVVTTKGLLQSLNVYKKIIKEIEKNFYPITENKCEPHLSKRNLYPTASIKNSLDQKTTTIKNILTYSDGKTSIKEISKKLNISYQNTLKILKFLKKNKLVNY